MLGCWVRIALHAVTYNGCTNAINPVLVVAESMVLVCTRATFIGGIPIICLGFQNINESLLAQRELTELLSLCEIQIEVLSLMESRKLRLWARLTS